MGVGFVTGGFCPGTSVCGAAIGKIDAMVFILGILVGVFVFSELYTLFEPIYDGYFLGNQTLMDSLGVSPYWFIFVFTIIALIAFFVVDQIRKKVKKVFY